MADRLFEGEGGPPRDGLSGRPRRGADIRNALSVCRRVVPCKGERPITSVSTSYPWAEGFHVSKRSDFARLSLLLVFILLVLPPTPSAAGPHEGRLRLVGSTAPYARASALVRDAADVEVVDFQMYLGLRDRTGAVTVLARVSDPASRLYGQYLTPAEFRARFSRPEADVTAVSTWLRDEGFQVSAAPANHLYVPATGTVAQVERSFDVSMNVTTARDVSCSGRRPRLRRSPRRLPVKSMGSLG